MQFFLKRIKKWSDGHLGFRIAPKSNNASSENLVEHYGKSSDFKWSSFGWGILKYLSQRQRLQCWNSNRSKKKYLRIFKRNISAKSADFTCSGSGEVENVSANQRPRQLSGISNHFKKIFFRTPIATINVVSWAWSDPEEIENVSVYDIQIETFWSEKAQLNNKC